MSREDIQKLAFVPERYFNETHLAEMYHKSELTLLDDVAKNPTGLVGIVTSPIKVGEFRRQTITAIWPGQTNPLVHNEWKNTYLIEGIEVGYIQERRALGSKLCEILRGVYDPNGWSTAHLFDIGKIHMERISEFKTVYPLYHAEGLELLKKYQEEQRIIREEAAMRIVPPF